MDEHQNLLFHILLVAVYYIYTSEMHGIRFKQSSSFWNSIKLFNIFPSSLGPFAQTLRNYLFVSERVITYWKH